MTKAALLAVSLLPCLAFAGPYRQRIDDALDALDQADRELSRASKDCRDGVAPSLRTVIAAVEDARGSPNAKRVDTAQMQLAGLALGAMMAGCPERLGDAMGEAQAALSRAKSLAAEADERDEREDRRERARDRDRRRYDDDDDGRDRRRDSRRGPRAMAAEDFDALVRAVGKEGFGDGKISVVKTASSAYFTADQVGRLVDQMSYSTEKVKVVALLNERIVDPQNSFRLYEHFTYSADKEAVKKLLAR